MNKPINGHELDAKFFQEKLEKTKSGSIAYIKEIDELTKGEIYHAHGETHLSPHDYGKNWQEKINSFKTEKEVSFYTNRLRAFMDFVKENTRKEINYVDANSPKQGDPANTPKLIEQELKRLENINEEEFNRTDKGGKSVEGKELSAEEMLNDPGFDEQIDNIFGLKKKQDLSQNCAFCSKIIDPLQYVQTDKKYFCNSECMLNKKQNKDTQDGYSQEVNSDNSNVDNKSLINSENSEKKSRLQNEKTNDEFPTGWIISGGILAIIGIVVIGRITKKRKKFIE